MNSGFPAARIDLDRLRRGPVDVSADLPGDPAAWGLADVEMPEAPKLEYRAESGGRDGVRVGGRLAVELSVSCRRCLRPVRCPLAIEFDFRFDASVQEADGERGVFPLDREAAVLDLSEQLREEMLLSVPEYPVCRDSCPGLCPRCGAELEEDEICGCGGEEPDPRWNVLRELVSDGGTVEHLDEYDGNDG